MVAWISDSQAVRLAVLIVALVAFSALYTYLGGLRAVVRTDLAQFVLLLGGGLITVSVAVQHLGGWSALRRAIDGTIAICCGPRSRCRGRSAAST